MKSDTVRTPVEDRAISLNELAYLRFRQALITLQYKPGDYLNMAQVMADLEVGRTPVNQAVHRLAAEGLLQILPRKGVMVAPLSLDDAFELIEVRLVNELLCIRLAAARITTGQIAQLREVNARLAQASQQRDPLAMMQCDNQFHHLLAGIAANRRLMDILNIIHAQAQRFWATTLSDAGHMEEVIVEHNAIITALEEGNLSAAEQATQHHILSFKHALLTSSGR
ncbi:GntR family transcriptional regulator [Erwinia sp. AnSW2-5]|uniref:GntR family transcriptional regulator n=1 Tax=Erwinia sp. AnSW2-5 TaxID=3367692 RepID=UPI00385BA12E